jgi:hypothetical protein
VTLKILLKHGAVTVQCDPVMNGSFTVPGDEDSDDESP